MYNIKPARKINGHGPPSARTSTPTCSTVFMVTGDTIAVQMLSPLSTSPMVNSIGVASRNDASHMPLISFLVRLRDMMLLALNGWQMAMYRATLRLAMLSAVA